MEKEKLYQAARSEAFDLMDCAHKTNSHDLVEAFVQGAEWLMQQPLSDRLTEEERKTIIFAYKASVKLIQETEITNPNASEVFRGQKQLLISLFGKDLFNDNPELLK